MPTISYRISFHHQDGTPTEEQWFNDAHDAWQAFRLFAEPRRLWRRYLVGNPRFVLLALRQWITRRPAPLGQVTRRPAGARETT